MSTSRYEITDTQRERIKDMLPKELPRRYGAKSTVHERFKSWKGKGIIEKIFAEISKDCDMQGLSFDSTSCKVHQHAAGAKMGPETRA